MTAAEGFKYVKLEKKNKDQDWCSKPDRFFGISKDKPLQAHQMTASVLKSQWHRETWRAGVESDCVRSTAFTCVSEASVFPISVQRPVLWRQTLPPQALNKPAQQRRERLFRTGPLQSRGQIAYLINAVMEKLEKAALLWAPLTFSLVFPPLCHRWILHFFVVFQDAFQMEESVVVSIYRCYCQTI